MNEQTDVRNGVEADADRSPRIGSRRLMRWITVLAVGIVVVLAVWQDSLA